MPVEVFSYQSSKIPQMTGFPSGNLRPFYFADKAD
jgi:hypothetical protein